MPLCVPGPRKNLLPKLRLELTQSINSYYVQRRSRRLKRLLLRALRVSGETDAWAWHWDDLKTLSEFGVFTPRLK